jgi:adenosylcobinamide kinase / adenosylcobinamide-phosphate guanylyltransferase
MTLTLVLGGARSGKSRFAENLAHGERHYVATAQGFDDEMQARIKAHQAQRGDSWVTHEAPLALAETLAGIDGAGRFILVDCLTLWLSNQILEKRDWELALRDLMRVAVQLKADVVFVSNEVGFGIVPDNPLARQFRDAQGLTNQRVAGLCNCVVLVAAGLPLALKGTLQQAQT